MTQAALWSSNLHSLWNTHLWVFPSRVLPENSQGTTLTVFTPTAHLFPLLLMTDFPTPLSESHPFHSLVQWHRWNMQPEANSYFLTSGQSDQLKNQRINQSRWTGRHGKSFTGETRKGEEFLLEKQQPDSEGKQLRGGRTEKHPDPCDSQEASISILW